MRKSHQTAQPSEVHNQPPQSQTTDGRNACHSVFIITMVGVGAIAFIYLVLLARAVSLDERCIQLDRQIAHAHSRRILAEQQLRSALTPDALGIDMSELPSGAATGTLTRMETPPLPELEPCAVLMVADAEALNEAATVERPTADEEPATVIASAEPSG